MSKLNGIAVHGSHELGDPPPEDVQHMIELLEILGREGSRRKVSTMVWYNVGANCILRAYSDIPKEKEQDFKDFVAMSLGRMLHMKETV